PARSPPDMADDRRVGSFLAGRPQSERPHGSSEPPQRVLDRTSHAPRSQRVGGGSRAERPSYLLPGASCPTGPGSLPARAAAPVPAAPGVGPAPGPPPAPPPGTAIPMTITGQAPTAGISGAPDWTFSAAVADLNGDGWPDMFLARHWQPANLW